MSKIEKRKLIKMQMVVDQVRKIVTLRFKKAKLSEMEAMFVSSTIAFEKRMLDAIKATPAKLFHSEKKKLDKRRQKRFRPKGGMLVLPKKGTFQGVQVVEVDWKIKGVEE